MAYTSEIDLGGLGEVPKTSDSEVFSDFTDVYNAIHILAQWTDMLYQDAKRKNPKEGDPWETMEFERAFGATATRNISAGSVVTVIHCDIISTHWSAAKRTVSGAVLGVACTYATSATLNIRQGGVSWSYNRYSQFMGGVTGIALEDAKAGEIVPIGIGPAIIQVNGARAGEPVLARECLEPEYNNILRARYYKLVNNGAMYRMPASKNQSELQPGYVPIGIGVAPNSVMIHPPHLGTSMGRWYAGQNIVTFPGIGGN